MSLINAMDLIQVVDQLIPAFIDHLTDSALVALSVRALAHLLVILHQIPPLELLRTFGTLEG